MPQDSLGFMLSQTALIKRDIYQQKYPSVDIAPIVPISMEGSGWESGIEHFSSDMVGSMEEISPQTTVLPTIDLTHQQHFVQISSYGACIRYNRIEVEQARMVPGVNLKRKKSKSLRRAHDQIHWDLVMTGRANLGWDGLINNANVTAVDARDGAGGSKLWKDKTALEIVRDINEALEGIYTGSNTVEMADTIALPPNVVSDLCSTVIPGTATTVMRFIRESNVYTMKTQKQLKFIEIRGLENAAAGNKGRMIAYQREPDVLEYHMLMPLRLFNPVHEHLGWSIPGITRSGGLEIKRPSAIRYVDLISE